MHELEGHETHPIQRHVQQDAYFAIRQTTPGDTSTHIPMSMGPNLIYTDILSMNR
jgi:hypothetical protein